MRLPMQIPPEELGSTNVAVAETMKTVEPGTVETETAENARAETLAVEIETVGITPRRAAIVS